MSKNNKSRGKRIYTQTITINNGIKSDANEKVTKTIKHIRCNNKRGRTLGEMVYEFAR